MQGRLDSPLTEEGCAQADEHGQVLNSLGEISGIWSSSAGRARETTELINQHLKQEVVYSDELVERDCGFWSGKTVDEIKNQDPEGYAALKNDPYGYRPGGGENIPDLVARISPRLLALSEERSPIIVSHGVVTKAILNFYLDLSEANLMRIIHPNNLFFCLGFRNNEVSVSHYVLEVEKLGVAQEGLYVMRDKESGPIHSE